MPQPAATVPVQRRAAAIVVFVLTAQAAMTIRRAQAADRAAKVSRRWGIAGGGVMGLCLLISQTPPISTSEFDIGTVSFVLALATPLIVGVLASARRRTVGRAPAQAPGQASSAG